MHRGETIMNKLEEHILKDFRSFVYRCLIEDRFDECLIKMSADISEVIMSKRAKRHTAGEPGRIIIARR